MGLPKLQLPIHIIELPISKQKIEIKPFVIREEKSLLTSINTDKKEDVNKLLKVLIDNCVLTKDFDVKSLNSVDFFYLIINIRMKSATELLSGGLTCEHCKKSTEFEINIEKSLIIENEDKIKVMCVVNDNLSLELISPNVDIYIEKADELDAIELIANSVNTVIYKDEPFTEFTISELKENILFNLTNNEIEKISKGMLNLPTLLLKFDFICMNCTKMNTYETRDILGFF